MLDKYPEIVYNKGTKEVEVKKMKKYTVRYANNASLVIDLGWALTIAKNASKVGGKVSVFDGERKVATFQNGEKIS